MQNETVFNVCVCVSASGWATSFALAFVVLSLLNERGISKSYIYRITDHRKKCRGRKPADTRRLFRVKIRAYYVASDLLELVKKRHAELSTQWWHEYRPANRNRWASAFSALTILLTDPSKIGCILRLCERRFHNVVYVSQITYSRTCFLIHYQLRVVFSATAFLFAISVSDVSHKTIRDLFKGHSS